MDITVDLVTYQGKKQMCVACRIKLDENQYDKLTDDRFTQRIDNIAKDFHVDWEIKPKDQKNILEITRTTTQTVDREYTHDLEVAAINFMGAVEDLSIESEEETSDQPSEVEFVKEIYDNMNGELTPDTVIGARLEFANPIRVLVNEWVIGTNLLKDMCAIYLEKMLKP